MPALPHAAGRLALARPPSSASAMAVRLAVPALNRHEHARLPASRDAWSPGRPSADERSTRCATNGSAMEAARWGRREIDARSNVDIRLGGDDDDGRRREGTPVDSCVAG